MEASRITAVNDAPVRRGRGGDYVLYWMIAARRTTYSHGLDRALDHAIELGRPLLVLEPLRAGYPWASDRLHAFVLQGMADNAEAFGAAGITYLPYVEPEPGHGSGLLEALAARACVVVTDEQPGFFQPRMVAAAGARLDVLLEQVDGCGLLPLRAAERAYPSAATFRRHLQRALPPHLTALPSPAPLAKLLRCVRGANIPRAVLRRWPAASAALLRADATALAALPIDHAVAPVPVPGGARAAADALDEFIEHRLPRYAEARNSPDDCAASGLSPYLHFGHIGAAAIAARVWREAGWDPSRLVGQEIRTRVDNREYGRAVPQQCTAQREVPDAPWGWAASESRRATPRRRGQATRGASSRRRPAR